MITLLVIAGCLVVGWVRKNRHRDVRVPEITQEEDCSADDPLLNHDLHFSDTAPSTYNQIECPPNTSEEGCSVLAPPQPLPPEAPPPTPNCEDMSEQLSSAVVQRRLNHFNFPLPPWLETPTMYTYFFDEDPRPPEDQSLTLASGRICPVSHPQATSEWDMHTALQSLAPCPEAPTINSDDEEPWPSENHFLTLDRRTSSPASYPFAKRSSTEDHPSPPQPFLAEILLPSPINEDPPECLLSSAITGRPRSKSLS